MQFCDNPIRDHLQETAADSSEWVEKFWLVCLFLVQVIVLLENSEETEEGSNAAHAHR